MFKGKHIHVVGGHSVLQVTFIFHSVLLQAYPVKTNTKINTKMNLILPKFISNL